jgi:predicted kinase
MLRAGIDNKKNPLILCGLSDDNIDRLRSGQPIKAELWSFGVNLPGTLSIIHGTTEADIEAILRKHDLIRTDSSGKTDPRIVAEAEARAQHKHILIAMCGLPRSGKSTWARKTSYPIVCPDAIRLGLHGQRYIELAEPFVWATAKLMVRSLFLSGHKHVVFDATNANRKRRKELESPDWGLYFKYIDTPKEVCLDRARETKDEAIKPVIERMAAAWEPLSEGEKLWP